ncbi:unnamed protein product [Blumeria hordei]|uniref:Uncharacterized protein n=1 Tax=Blumeria hordei TaxID=2867405 RepID=A0A383UKH6_BLUHO|nr:unnamed protein product [Blumeria hordei]
MVKICLLSTVIAFLYATNSSAIHFLVNDAKFTAVFDPTVFRNVPVKYMYSIEYYCSHTHQYDQKQIDNVITYAKAIFHIRKKYKRERPIKWYPVKKYINGFLKKGPFRIQPISPGSDIPPTDETLYKDYVIMDFDFNFITIIYFAGGNSDHMYFNECYPLSLKRMISEVSIYNPGTNLMLPNADELKRIKTLRKPENRKRRKNSVQIQKMIDPSKDKMHPVKILSNTSNSNQLDESSSSRSHPIYSDDNDKIVSNITPSKELPLGSEQNSEPSRSIPMTVGKDDKENSPYPNPMPVSPDLNKAIGNPVQMSRSASPIRQEPLEVGRGRSRSRSSHQTENRNAESPTLRSASPNPSHDAKIQNQDSNSISPNIKHLPEMDSSGSSSGSLESNKEEERSYHEAQPNSPEEEHKIKLELGDTSKFPSLQEAQQSKSSPKRGDINNTRWPRLERKKNVAGNANKQVKTTTNKARYSVLDTITDKNLNNNLE